MTNNLDCVTLSLCRHRNPGSRLPFFLPFSLLLPPPLLTFSKPKASDNVAIPSIPRQPLARLAPTRRQADTDIKPRRSIPGHTIDQEVAQAASHTILNHPLPILTTIRQQLIILHQHLIKRVEPSRYTSLAPTQTPQHSKVTSLESSKKTSQGQTPASDIPAPQHPTRPLGHPTTSARPRRRCRACHGHTRR